MFPTGPRPPSPEDIPSPELVHRFFKLQLTQTSILQTASACISFSSRSCPPSDCDLQHFPITTPTFCVFPLPQPNSGRFDVLTHHFWHEQLHSILSPRPSTTFTRTRNSPTTLFPILNVTNPLHDIYFPLPCHTVEPFLPYCHSFPGLAQSSHDSTHNRLAQFPIRHTA